MKLRYKKAEPSDIEALTETRIEVLRAANRLPTDADIKEIDNGH